MSKPLSTSLKANFGTAPVFFTAISTILGAILFLRFGYAVGNVGFLGTVAIIFIGHLVTIPTAMAIAEIATNQKVEGGGEYYIISRSFGLNIGAAIGIALFFSQAISVAFYVIAFAESFESVIVWVHETYGFGLDKRAISLPAMGLLALLILTKGADLGVKALYIVVAVLGVSLLFFFAGTTEYASLETTTNWYNRTVTNGDSFFYVFAICFPGFTGMTAGVGLSGDLKDPSYSIPLGTLAATIIGMFMYIIIAYKLAVSASPEVLADLENHQLVMGEIAFWEPIIPIGLACATISSALGSIMVAPRTLQVLGADKVMPMTRFSQFVSLGKGSKSEPFNASLVTILIAFCFVAIGDVNFVAEIISMFFMLTYGSLCLISFLQHFAADPSYRPTFRSKWYISLLGFVMCIWLMFKMNALYAVLALSIMIILYITITAYNKDKKGMAAIFQGVAFQISRQIQIFLQKAKRSEENWRPSVVCISDSSFERFHAFNLLRWLSHKYGFGTYIHLINGYYSKASKELSRDSLDRLKNISDDSNIYLDTLISPSYTSAVAQTIQLPGVSGKENNMIMFEFAKKATGNLEDIIDNYHLVKAGAFDVVLLGSSDKGFGRRQSIHIWIKPKDYENANLMILLGYIIAAHPDWKKANINIFSIFPEDQLENQKAYLKGLIKSGRLPISENNIAFLPEEEEKDIRTMINEKSRDASLTIVGFRSELVKKTGKELFMGYDDVGSILFVNSHRKKEIK